MGWIVDCGSKIVDVEEEEIDDGEEEEISI
jgi:hypothetical protein